MNEAGPPPWSWIVAGMTGMFLLVTTLISVLGGWWSLMRDFRAEGWVEGERFRFVSGRMGWRFFSSNYGNCLFLTITPQGLRLSTLFPVSLMHPPLFLPWEAMESVELSSALFFKSVRLRVRGHWPEIVIYGRPGEALHQAYGAWRPTQGSTEPPALVWPHQ